MVKSENGQCWPQLNTNKLIMNKRILLNKNVCRSITFGKCRDVEESNEFLRIELDNLRRKERARWNFDFYNDRPCMSDGDDLDEDDSENEKSETTTNTFKPRRYQWTKCKGSTNCKSSLVSS